MSYTEALAISSSLNVTKPVWTFYKTGKGLWSKAVLVNYLTAC